MYFGFLVSCLTCGALSRYGSVCSEWVFHNKTHCLCPAGLTNMLNKTFPKLQSFGIFGNLSYLLFTLYIPD